VVSYFFAEKSVSDIFIGIKYGFWRMFILLSATSIGFFYHEKFRYPALYGWLKWGLILTVLIGFLRQGMKLWKPEFFSFI
jgi:hypothetical protein